MRLQWTAVIFLFLKKGGEGKIDACCFALSLSETRSLPPSKQIKIKKKSNNIHIWDTISITEENAVTKWIIDVSSLLWG